MVLNPKIIIIAQKLKKYFLDELTSLNEISIFICGGSKKEELDFRKELGKNISGVISKYRYAVYYPEDMFIELMLGHAKHDLLSLENILADSVNVIAILLQSPGTFTELGAFANHEKLRDKLIVVIDPKYSRSRSFINLGPIRHLKSKTRSVVLYSPINKVNLENLVKQIINYAREISKYSKPINDLSNPIASYEFYLALIYVFDPISKETIFNIITKLTNYKQDIILTVAETVINSLVNERKISFVSGNLSMTSKGVNALIYENKSKKRSTLISLLLTDFRFESLNLTLRKDRI